MPACRTSPRPTRRARPRRRLASLALASTLGSALLASALLGGALPAPAATPVGAASLARSTYVVLGDSYASGEGNPAFDPGTAASPAYPGSDTSSSCHRSYRAWGRLIERRAGLKLLGHFACSGATTASLSQPYKNKPAQIGRLAKLTAAGNEPALVYLTIGGNDVGFASVAATCYQYGQTSACTQALVQASARVQALPDVLTRTYLRIARAAPQARIVVVGYPGIISPDSSDATLRRCPWISAANRQRLAEATAGLDAVIRSTVANRPAEVEADYVSTLGALAGHELCTASPWINPIDVSPMALATGTYAYSAHPNGAGQRAIAAVLAPTPR